jgi:hypothetical protein
MALHAVRAVMVELAVVEMVHVVVVMDRGVPAAGAVRVVVV